MIMGYLSVNRFILHCKDRNYFLHFYISSTKGLYIFLCCRDMRKNIPTMLQFYHLHWYLNSNFRILLHQLYLLTICNHLFLSNIAFLSAYELILKRFIFISQHIPLVDFALRNSGGVVLILELKIPYLVLNTIPH